MPIRMKLPLDGNDQKSSGIIVEWVPTAKRLDIWGWYDSFVGIDGCSLSLKQFFTRLGITEKDCDKAWREVGK